MKRIVCALAFLGCGDGESQPEVAPEVEVVEEVAPEVEVVEEVAPEVEVVEEAEVSEVSEVGEVETETTRTSWATLVSSYDLLESVAGRGAARDEGIEWRVSMEGGAATLAELSRPHQAQADALGRIFIADKEAHAIRRVDLDGTIHTVAGTNVPGDDGDTPGPAVQKRLTDPNGLYVLDNDVVHILDQGNGKVRRLATDGTLTTFITVPGGIATGRGLWVAEDESYAYIAAGNRLLKWQAGIGVSVLVAGFVELGNLVVDPDGHLVVTDRGGHRVYRIGADGSKTPIAGNGARTGGGDGQAALATGLDEPRAVWFLPEDVGGGYLVGTHEGNQVWYVDPAGTIRLLLDGGDGHAYSGDGQYFRTPGKKVSEVRAITVANNGDIIITENDYGRVRRIVRRSNPLGPP